MVRNTTPEPEMVLDAPEEKAPDAPEEKTSAVAVMERPAVPAAEPANLFEPRTPTNIVVMVGRIGNKYQYGDRDTYANVLTYFGATPGLALWTSGAIADITAGTAIVTAALANNTYRTAMLAVDKKNRGASTETLS